MKISVLVIGESATLAHVVRPFTIAKALHEQGLDVHFAADSYFAAAFEHAHFPVHTLKSRSPTEFRRIVETNDIIFPAELLREYIDNDLELIDTIQPHVILQDFRRSLTVSAVVARIPVLTLTNSYWSPYVINRRFPAPCSADIADAVKSGTVSATELVETAEGEFNKILGQVFQSQAEGLDTVRSEWGLSPFPDYLTGATWGDRVLYADLPTIVGMERIPASHRFLGPVTWAPKLPLPSWWDSIPRSAVVIYVSIGSSGFVDLLPLISNIAPRMNCYFVIATGGAPIPDSLPPRCFAAEYLPGDLVAQRASVMITNGGSPSAYQALNAGVPVLGIPLNMDQLLFMQHLVQSGAARSIRADCISEENLLESISSMLTLPSFRGAAENFKQHCATIDFKNEIHAILSEVVRGSDRLVENG